jgi:hypothetical protein
MTVVYFAAADVPRPVQWKVRLQLRDGATTQDFSGLLTRVNEEQEFWTADWKQR